LPVERTAAVIGLDGAIGGFTPLVEWTAPELLGEKSRDFALALGPVVTTADEGAPAGVDWERLVAHAAENTRLYPGDLLAA
jgi:2-keto-4-pentenoate hydratase/2-oxohepta-3-ene-1,7-dioic acid hydratase in catechol pathway